jgi:hypothetical protein
MLTLDYWEFIFKPIASSPHVAPTGDTGGPTTAVPHHHATAAPTPRHHLRGRPEARWPHGRGRGGGPLCPTLSSDRDGVGETDPGPPRPDPVITASYSLLGAQLHANRRCGNDNMVFFFTMAISWPLPVALPSSLLLELRFQLWALSDFLDTCGATTSHSDFFIHNTNPYILVSIHCISYSRYLSFDSWYRLTYSKMVPTDFMCVPSRHFMVRLSWDDESSRPIEIS